VRGQKMDDEKILTFKIAIANMSTPSLIRLCEIFLLRKEKGFADEKFFNLIRQELKARNYPLIKIGSVEVW